ncbi:hypothetical protein B0H16DRAFT_129491 [Mycena metata]|uniref:Uncharacterized protein n=1 Tax=Mycena metata TaxID=1033252 RepID=A0AAD7I5C0_9AGAR|nr:hypothetical protein B0H16DRAFT_129491 [Mycena metata]
MSTTAKFLLHLAVKNPRKQCKSGVSWRWIPRYRFGRFGAGNGMSTVLWKGEGKPLVRWLVRSAESPSILPKAHVSCDISKLYSTHEDFPTPMNTCELLFAVTDWDQLALDLGPHSHLQTLQRRIVLTDNNRVAAASSIYMIPASPTTWVVPHGGAVVKRSAWHARTLIAAAPILKPAITGT